MNPISSDSFVAPPAEVEGAAAGALMDYPRAVAADRPAERRATPPHLNGSEPHPRAVPDEASGDAADDNVLLLCAVKERLDQALQDSRLTANESGFTDVLHLLTILRDCVEALDRVHGGLIGDYGQRQQLELDKQAARAAMVRAQVRLASTEVGVQPAHHPALHDGLTALPNRRYLLAQLNAALSPEPLNGGLPALLYLDLNGFKAVTDIHGHAVADHLLRIVATRLKHAVRSADVVSRLGGDAFACLLFGASDREQLRRLAGKIHAAVASTLKLGELELSVWPSIGIAIARDTETTAEMLLAQADAAMNLAKRQLSVFAFFEEKNQVTPTLAWPLPAAAHPH